MFWESLDKCLNPYVTQNKEMRGAFGLSKGCLFFWWGKIKMKKWHNSPGLNTEDIFLGTFSFILAKLYFLENKKF